MQLWLCLRLPEFAVQCLPQQRPLPAAAVEQQRLHTVNAAAAMLGLEPGMDPASARALAAEAPLQLLARDRELEAKTLESLCCWAYGVTPQLYGFRGDCLMLEIGGSLRLFGGLDAILRHCRRGLASRGYSVELAVAQTPIAAWALSHSDAPEDAIDTALTERLGRLATRSLVTLDSQFEALERSGLHYLSEVFALPPATLAKRCGEAFGQLLQELRGERTQATTPFEPPSCFHDSYPLGYPVRNQEELGPALEHLLESLEHYLRQRQLETRSLQWIFVGMNAYQESLEVRASGSGMRREDWYRLTRLRLERQPFRDDVEVVQLRVTELTQIQAETASLFRHSAHTTSPSHLVDILSNRLGSRAISSLRCRDGNLPEDSYSTVSPDGQDSTARPPASQRPFWLLPEPESLGQRSEHLSFWGNALTLIYGPERIEDRWWHQGTSRDYFIAHNNQGQRFWVFHERRKREWFLHGFFA